MSSGRSRLRDAVRFGDKGGVGRKPATNACSARVQGMLRTMRTVWRGSLGRHFASPFIRNAMELLGSESDQWTCNSEVCMGQISFN